MAIEQYIKLLYFNVHLVIITEIYLNFETKYRHRMFRYNSSQHNKHMLKILIKYDTSRTIRVIITSRQIQFMLSNLH